MRITRYGPDAGLVRVDDPAGWALAVRAAGIVDIEDVVPAEDTVLVRTRPGTWPSVAERLAGVDAASSGAPAHDVTIDVSFDGADLRDVATAAGLDDGDVVRRVCDATYHVAFCGFSPGFAYLTGLDPALALPRRPTPRMSVPAGSFAIAASYAAVYPTASPGGWHLLGTTDAVVWDPGRDEPALLAPGTTVHVVER